MRKLVSVNYEELERMLRGFDLETLKRCSLIAARLLEQQQLVGQVDALAPACLAHIAPAAPAADVDTLVVLKPRLDVVARPAKPVQRIAARNRWSYEETCMLVRGLNAYGVGKWAKIAENSGLSRTNLQIKDRYANLVKHGHLIFKDGSFILIDKSRYGNLGNGAA